MSDFKWPALSTRNQALNSDKDIAIIYDYLHTPDAIANMCIVDKSVTLHYSIAGDYITYSYLLNGRTIDAKVYYDRERETFIDGAYCTAISKWLDISFEDANAFIARYTNYKRQ